MPRRHRRYLVAQLHSARGIAFATSCAAAHRLWGVIALVVEVWSRQKPLCSSMQRVRLRHALVATAAFLEPLVAQAEASTASTAAAAD